MEELPGHRESRRQDSGSVESVGQVVPPSSLVYISPYDPEKRVWVVDDNMQAIYIFTHDGKQLLQTIGTPEVEGADATHFNRPTYIDWEPNGDFFVSDGYTGTRVAKFDKSGKFLMQWGTKGGPRNNRTPTMKRAPATSATCTA